MLFIKTSKCFTVHCSFTLPAGAGAVIPVSEGSDGGHCWPVGVAAHHKSTEPLRTTLQLLSSLMGSLGGESQGWWGLRYLASLPHAVYHVGRSKYVAHAAATFTSPVETTEIRDLEVDSYVFTPRLSGICLVFNLSASSRSLSASPPLDPVESDTVCNSMREYRMMGSREPQRQHWMLTFYPAWSEWHCWICVGVSRRRGQSRRKRTEWENLNLEDE